MNEQNNLQELLEKLNNELKNVDVTDEAGRERVRQLNADIRSLLERASDADEKDEPMLERFQESIDHFEDTHPQLTLMLSEMMTILSNAGI
jgi:hypothetical protein